MMTNTGYLSNQFTENSVNYNGNKSPNNYPLCRLTKERRRAERTVKEMAKEQRTSIDNIISQIIANSKDQLAAYVIGKGETPATDVYALGAQAALIRAAEVAGIAASLDITDEQALCDLECSEQELTDMNSMDQSPLDPAAMAALKLTADYLNKKAVQSGNVGTLATTMDALYNSYGQGNGIDLSVANILKGANISGSPTNPNAGNVMDDQGIMTSYKLNGLDIATATGNQTINTPPTVTPTDTGSGSTTWDSIFNVIDKVVTGAQTVAGAIGQGTGSVNDLLQNAQNAGANVGSQAINQSIQKYTPYIIMGFVALLVIILLAAYVNRR